ncbi:MAG: 16S rRNA (guanine(966)-N(2))-methyltransferase RsmD [Micrococcales bacterium]
MTRIIGGIAGSLRLGSPAKATRPTSDRIRESIFSRLEARDLIDGASVLDLYAGTGALGLEAASRGSSNIVLIDKDGKAAAVCKANGLLVQKALNKDGVEVSIRVTAQAATAFLAAPTAKFDLVFIDPPYEVDNAEVVANLEALTRALEAEATVVVERSSRGEKLSVPSAYELEEIKNYGDTDVYWLSAK